MQFPLGALAIPTLAKRQQSRSGLIIALVLAFLMISSVLGFFYAGQEAVHQRGYKFVRGERAWEVELAGERVEFFWLPDELTTITLPEGTLKSLHQAQLIWISYDQESYDPDQLLPLAQFRLGRALASAGLFAMPALARPNQYNLSVITCSNASAASPVIFLSLEKRGRLLLENNCLELSGEAELERLLYAIYGVM